MAAHHFLGLSQALHDGFIGVIQENVQGHGVGKACDDAGDEQQQRPQADEQSFQHGQENDLIPNAEAVKNVAVAGGFAAEQVQEVNVEAGENHRQRNIQQYAQNIAHGGGHHGAEELQGIVDIAGLNVVHVLLELGDGHVDAQNAGGKLRHDKAYQQVDTGHIDGARLGLADKLRGIAL